MAADFPTTVKTFTAKTNDVDTIDASHMNDLQDEMNAVETLLGAASKRRTSWTPVITFETGSLTSVTYTSANTGGWYSQFGSLIAFSVRFEITAISYGTATGNLNVSLPPVTAVSGNFSLTSATVSTATGWTTLFPAIGRIVSASQVMRLFSYSAATGHTVITNTHTGTPSGGTPLTLIASGFYFHS